MLGLLFMGNWQVVPDLNFIFVLEIITIGSRTLSVTYYLMSLELELISWDAEFAQRISEQFIFTPSLSP